jgi:hypothetical protein
MQNRAIVTGGEKLNEVISIHRTVVIALDTIVDSAYPIYVCEAI